MAIGRTGPPKRRTFALGVAGRAVALAIAVTSLGSVPTASADDDQRAQPRAGHWEAVGPGGARLAFVVIAKGERRFAGDMVALCGDNEADINGSAYTVELDDHGRGRVAVTTAFPTFALRHSGGTVSRTGDVRDRYGRVVCPATAFRGLRARYVGPVYVRDGEWQLIASLGGFGALQTRGGGSLVSDFVAYPGLSLTDPPVPCVGLPIGAFPNPEAGPTARIFPVGAFTRELTVPAGTGPEPGELKVAGQFVGTVTALGVYDISTGHCKGLGSWVAHWQRPWPLIVITLPGAPPVELQPPPGVTRPGADPDATARAIQRRRPKVHVNSCVDARDLVRQLRHRYGTGASATTTVVYWAPPAPPGKDVRYVGISPLATRCRAHPRTSAHDSADPEPAAACTR